ncbi:putative oxidoreductase GLYR1 like protein [Lucilia cuprina]|nr:putative oxidoreductase GLYR1 like protein [Lucilia cuprina]
MLQAKGFSMGQNERFCSVARYVSMVVVTGKLCTKITVHIIPEKIKDSNNQWVLKNTSISKVEKYCCEGYHNVSNTCKPYCSNSCLNGICVEPDKCECHSGYKWNIQTYRCEIKCDIQKYIFDSLTNKCTPICSTKCENGTCIAPDTCECNKGYKFNNYTIQCEPLCLNCANGKCISPNKCECNKGYKFNVTKQCEPISHKIANPCVQIVKMENAKAFEKCSNGKYIASGKCECNKGYKLNVSTEICQPFCSSNCNNGDQGRCIAPEKCECNSGYKLNNSTKNCEPICSEHSKCKTKCSTTCENGKCFDANPTKCICNSGYIFSSNTNSCIPQCTNPCTNGICIAPEKCICRPGYKLNSFSKRCMLINYKESAKAQDQFSLEKLESSIKCENGGRYNKTLKLCQPLCNVECSNGNCIAANTCICNSGYILNGTTGKCESTCNTLCTDGHCDSGDCECNPGYIKSLNRRECEKLYLYILKLIFGLIFIGLIVEPPLELLNNTHKNNSKCVFFFGSRNFAWIEFNNIKPYEGPWKDQLSKLNKPAAFRQAMEDIKNHIDDPTEIDGIISKSTGIRTLPTEADFDKIRDGYSVEEEITIDTNANNVENNGETSAVEDDEGVAAKTPNKRTPKAKSTAAASTKAKSTISKSTTKRRGSAQIPATVSSASSKRKRKDSEFLNDNTTPRRKINTDALAHIGGHSSPPRRNNNSIALLERPTVKVPEQQAIDMNTRSQTLAERDIAPSDLTFGFLGLGIMGSTIVKDLICKGHKVVVWNRTMSKCEPFREAGAVVKETPMDVVDASDIIFCCVSDPKASKDLVFGNCGVLRVADLCNKAYVEMTTIDPETSQDIAEGITQSNGRYLEVQIHGTRQEAEDGMLIILAGGDRTVFEECHSCFKTIAKNTFFLGDVGNACKVNLILQTILGVSLVGLSEALALADRFSISLKDILDIFQLTSMKSDLLLAKGREMAKGDFNPQQPLSHMQKDLRLVLSMAENLDQSMPVTAITNEVFKHTKRLGYSEHDSSAVFVRSRF